MESEIDLNMNMKTSRIILVALAAIAAVACGPKVSETTRVKVVFEGEAPEAVKLSLPAAAIDQTVPVNDGKFQVELPTSKTGFASLQADNMRIEFISDGTPLTISISADSASVSCLNIPNFPLITGMKSSSRPKPTIGTSRKRVWIPSKMPEGIPRR